MAIAGERRRWARPCRRLARLAAVAAAVAAPAAAHAATATVSNGVLEVDGTEARDEIAILTPWDGGDTIAIENEFMTMTSGPGCRTDDDGFALCARPSVRAIDVHLGAGNDALLVRAAVPVTAFGDAGDDTLTALTITALAPGALTLDGGPGDDRLAGGPGNDVLLGGPGDDAVDGHQGDDIVDPGTGRDSVADTSGNDTIEAADGESDYVNCGPGTDTGTFDLFDVAVDCELGNLPEPSAPNCVPEIGRAALARLRGSRTVTIQLTAEDGCALRAYLVSAHRVVPGRATMSPHGTLTIRLGPRAVRRLGRTGHATLVVQSVAAGQRPILRRVRVDL